MRLYSHKIRNKIAIYCGYIFRTLHRREFRLNVFDFITFPQKHPKGVRCLKCKFKISSLLTKIVLHIFWALNEWARFKKKIIAIANPNIMQNSMFFSSPRVNLWNWFSVAFCIHQKMKNYCLNWIRQKGNVFDEAWSF